MFVYRDCKWRDLPKLIARVVRTVGMVMIMIGFSIAFGYMMAILQVPAKAAAFFVAISSDKYTFLLYINILLLLLGTFMDLAPMLLICTPIFLPIIKQFGIDPVHFGIIMILNLGIGLLTRAGRTHHGDRLRHRRRQHGGGTRFHPGVLRADAGGAHPDHLPAGAIALASSVVLK